jgi:hypothetical protein
MPLIDLSSVMSDVGVAVCLAAPVHHKLTALGVAVVAASCGIMAFGVVAHLLGQSDLRRS